MVSGRQRHILLLGCSNLCGECGVTGVVRALSGVTWSLPPRAEKTHDKYQIVLHGAFKHRGPPAPGLGLMRCGEGFLPLPFRLGVEFLLEILAGLFFFLFRARYRVIMSEVSIWPSGNRNMAAPPSQSDYTVGLQRTPVALDDGRGHTTTSGLFHSMSRDIHRVINSGAGGIPAT